MDIVNPVLPKAVSGPLWTRLSVSFANGTTRDAYVFQNASDGVRINSILSDHKIIWRNHKFEIADRINLVATKAGCISHVKSGGESSRE